MWMCVFGLYRDLNRIKLSIGKDGEFKVLNGVWKWGLLDERCKYGWVKVVSMS